MGFGWEKWRWRLVAGGLLVAMALQASEEQGHGEGHTITHRMMIFVLQLGVIIIAAKIGGFVAARWLKIPEVLGELAAGALISPYAFGGMVGFFTVVEGSAIPVSPEIYAVATLASIIMLYLVGLETDLRMFLRYSVTGTLVGMGGVLGSFILGAMSAVWLLPGVDSFMSPAALFLGVISTATSVGITARILAERRALDTPEGVTILAGAVIDDILGIILLAVVISLGKLGAEGGSIPWGKVALIGARAFGFWLVCTALCLLLANHIKRVLEIFGSRQTMATLSLGLALLLAGFAEMAQLAMIIGAYTMGLGLSRVDGAREMMHRLEPVYHTLVSVFFCVMGMMINVHAMAGVLGFAVIYTLIAIVAKVVGCGLPVLARGFNFLGATRVGIGMLPRGEVALIVAGVGLASGIVGNDVFGVALLMTVVTTIIAPLMLVRIIDKRPGVKDREGQDVDSEVPDLCCSFDNVAEADFFLNRMLDTFRDEGCYVNRVSTDVPLYLVRKEAITVTVQLEEGELQIDCSDDDREFVKLVVMEAMAEVIRSFQHMQKKGQETFRSEFMQA